MKLLLLAVVLVTAFAALDNDASAVTQSVVFINPVVERSIPGEPQRQPNDQQMNRYWSSTVAIIRNSSHNDVVPLQYTRQRRKGDSARFRAAASQFGLVYTGMGGNHRVRGELSVLRCEKRAKFSSLALRRALRSPAPAVLHPRFLS